MIDVVRLIYCPLRSKNMEEVWREERKILIEAKGFFDTDEVSELLAKLGFDVRKRVVVFES